MTGQRVIRLRRDAPPKPAAGSTCNGCGVCCAWAPCPLGMMVSGRRVGRCRALRWDGERYRCRLLAQPARAWRWLPRAWAQGLAARWIGAGRGCDAALSAQAKDPAASPAADPAADPAALPMSQATGARVDPER